MSKFLFIYGYESPQEWECNRRLGTDNESSGSVLVSARSEEDAIAAGIRYADDHVASLFSSFQQLSFPGWSAAGYAYSVEREPLASSSVEALKKIPEIQAPDSQE